MPGHSPSFPPVSSTPRLCSLCGTGTIGPVKLCRGVENPSHNGLWYETVRVALSLALLRSAKLVFLQCSNHSYDNPDSCRGFFWRKDLPRVATGWETVPDIGTSPDQAPRPQTGGCPGTHCSAKKQPAKGNAACRHGGRCADCCRSDQRLGLFALPCAVPNHNPQGVSVSETTNFRPQS